MGISQYGNSLLRRNGHNPSIVLKEFIDSIKDIDNDKSPDPDCLCKEFHMTFIDIFAPLLLDTIRDNEKGIRQVQFI